MLRLQITAGRLVQKHVVLLVTVLLHCFEGITQWCYDCPKAVVHRWSTAFWLGGLYTLKKGEVPLQRLIEAMPTGLCGGRSTSWLLLPIVHIIYQRCQRN